MTLTGHWAARIHETGATDRSHHRWGLRYRTRPESTLRRIPLQTHDLREVSRDTSLLQCPSELRLPEGPREGNGRRAYCEAFPELPIKPSSRRGAFRLLKKSRRGYGHEGLRCLNR